MSCGNCAAVKVTLQNKAKKGYLTGVSPWEVDVDKRYSDKTEKPDKADGKYNIEWTIEAKAQDLSLVKARIDFKGKTHFVDDILVGSPNAQGKIIITTQQIKNDVPARDDYVYDITIWFTDADNVPSKVRRILIDPGYRVKP
jgi:hypothetical protein